MAELSSGNDGKNVSRTGSFNLFGKSPSRSFSKKSSSNNPLKRIFSKKKSEKQSVSEDERDASISNEAETEMIEDDAPSVVEKTEKVVLKVIEEAKEVVPKAIEEATKVVPKVSEEASTVVPKLFQEVVHETKKVDPIAESKRDIIDSKNSPPATENKPVESLVDKLKEEKEKIEAELHEKAKDSGLERVYKAIIEQPHNVPSNDQPLDDKQMQERSVNIDEVKGEIQSNEKEDNCVASLAQGLQQICAQWNTKKED